MFDSFWMLWMRIGRQRLTGMLYPLSGFFCKIKYQLAASAPDSSMTIGNYRKNFWWSYDTACQAGYLQAILLFISNILTCVLQTLRLDFPHYILSQLQVIHCKYFKQVEGCLRMLTFVWWEQDHNFVWLRGVSNNLVPLYIVLMSRNFVINSLHIGHHWYRQFHTALSCCLCWEHVSYYKNI